MICGLLMKDQIQYGNTLPRKESLKTINSLEEGGYPLSIAFDSENKVWFTQVFGKRLGILDPSLVENNTTKWNIRVGFLESNTIYYNGSDI